MIDLVIDEMDEDVWQRLARNAAAVGMDLEPYLREVLPRAADIRYDPRENDVR